LPVADFMTSLARNQVARVPGTAVFLTRVKDATPPVMCWYVKHSHALHETVVAVSLETASVPWVAGDHRLGLEEIAPGFWAAHACYGFMERPDLPQLMKQLAAHGCEFDPAKLTYFVGSERIIPREDGRGLPRWMEVLFSAMLRNSVHLTDYLRVPRDQLIDLGRQISV
jgi:KUP system potassium uptake protein